MKIKIYTRKYCIYEIEILRKIQIMCKHIINNSMLFRILFWEFLNIKLRLLKRKNGYLSYISVCRNLLVLTDGVFLKQNIQPILFMILLVFAK